jgi:hypothetical protein
MTWLGWKLNHGLAARGRPAPLKPKGVIAKVLYFFHFRYIKIEAVSTGAATFTQEVGGSLGPSGKMNGD